MYLLISILLIKQTDNFKISDFTDKCWKIRNLNNFSGHLCSWKKFRTPAVACKHLSGYLCPKAPQQSSLDAVLLKKYYLLEAANPLSKEKKGALWNLKVKKVAHCKCHLKNGNVK